MSYETLDNRNFVFALDIGTRSVIGILGKRIKDQIHIEHIVVEFHHKRVMYNGQIHDIEGVAEIVGRVKLALEEKAKCTLDSVAVAAAGRSLITNKVTIDREIDPLKEIDKDLISSLEVEGLQKAQYEIESQCRENSSYFCVGHTIMHYYINDGMIVNPLGHKGNRVRLDILATFLPQIVVDSLYAVTAKLNLEIAYMTLEPIAAIEVAIPENARLLNLALVDIGAGTSDIAITKDGTIVAYGMTSCAGDHITEEIAQSYLLDFDTAESLKINLNKEKVQRFSDIVGIPYEIESAEILRKIEPAIDHVAKLIAENIMAQNGKSPSAVFLIGGGSQIPFLNKFIARALEMPEERVVIRGIETIKNTVVLKDPIFGPEYITPIGILSKAINNQELDFIKIYINGQQFKLFQTKMLKVMDALVLAGFNPRDLIPKRGRSIGVTINHIKKILYGEYGQVAEILINGKASNIESSINDGDILTIIPAKEGRSANYYVTDIVPVKNQIFINGEPRAQVYHCTINGKEADENKLIEDGDHIEYAIINSVQALCDYLNIAFDDYCIKVNGERTFLESPIRQEDHMDVYKKAKEDFSEEKDAVEEEPRMMAEEAGMTEDEISTSEGIGAELQCPQETISVKCNDEIIHMPKKQNGIIFVDIFDHIDFDRSRVKGKLVLLLNGGNANYTDPIDHGDEIKIYWEN